MVRLSNPEMTADRVHVLPGFGLRHTRAAGIVELRLPMLSHVAVSTNGHKVIERIVARLAPFDLVVELQILQRAALLTAQAVPLQGRFIKRR